MNKKLSSKEKKANLTNEDTEFGTDFAAGEKEAIQKVQQALFEMHNQAGIYNNDEE